MYGTLMQRFSQHLMLQTAIQICFPPKAARPIFLQLTLANQGSIDLSRKSENFIWEINQLP